MTTAEAHTVVMFGVAQWLFGIPASQVDRVLPVVEILPLPDAPKAVAGIVDCGGTVGVVLDLRRRFNLPVEPVRVSQRLVAVPTRRHLVLVLADQVEGVRAIDRAALMGLPDVAPGTAMVHAVGALPEGLIYIYDVETLLTAAEELDLAAALEAMAQA